jgi:hypothetical protein
VFWNTQNHPTKLPLQNIQDIKSKFVDKGVITEQNLRASIKQAMESAINVKRKEKKSSITSKSETMIGTRKLKKSIQSTTNKDSDDDLFTNPHLDDGNQPNKGDAKGGTTEVKQLAQRATTFMEKVAKVPITNEEEKNS